MTSDIDHDMEDLGRSMRGGRRRWARLASALAVVAVGGALFLGGPFVAAKLADRAPVPEPTPTPTSTPPDPAREVDAIARSFLAAWAREDWDRLQDLTLDQSLDAGGVHERAHATLQLRSARFFPYAPQIEGDTARVPYTGTWDLGELGRYRYRGTLRLARTGDEGDEWRVRWWYPTLHPDMTSETHLQRTRVFPTRAPILDRDGEPLARSRQRILVGIQPARVRDTDQVARVLSRTTRAEEADIRSLLDRDDLEPDGFYRVTALPPHRYEALRPRLFPIDGVVFRRRQPRQRPHRRVGAELIGALEAPTAEDLEALGGDYQPGDLVGDGGLEEAFEAQLAGKPAYEAAIVDDLGLVRSLGFSEGEDPQPLRTTLDVSMQRAAEAALGAAPKPSALVAIDSRTGEVRAAASTPRNAFNRALSGVYPPGSTFKVVTSTAVLNQGRTPRSRMRCPAAVRIGRPPIRNAGNARYGRVTFNAAFFRSCNTTFARLGVAVGADAMTAAAQTYGFNRELDFTLPAAGGSFPRPDGMPELARAAIGQARIQVSPLHMASVAATAATGEYRPPTLLSTDEREPQGRVDVEVRDHLHTMMRAVVERGTGTAAQMPREPVLGKTGSAQFAGGGDRTHAWFIGFRGHLAFAVLIEEGGGGGGVAAPVARDFLQRIGPRAVRSDAAG